ncbi:SH3 domain-containing protein 2 [Dichanthelium oligosanthes]|uniref:SH3 domain-containing protein 2 n=1 Tax=Dichanthelium oligosanthes TaxID=888268 RepID=A0A1E5V1V5_9POAL|nr:SH3 domain-containing protein 2 [Dichanthelium oligosanthes]
MEALWKQASRLKEQVARQGVFKQFGYGNSDNAFTDESEVKLHQRLEKLYLSTRAAKHFQRDIVRGVEGYIVTGSKQVELGNKLSDDSQKYGVENTCTSGDTLSKAATYFGKARSQMEKERGNMLKAFGTQVAEPLRAMVMGAPLEDARHLAQRYDRMRQEAEAQVNIFSSLLFKFPTMMKFDSSWLKFIQEDTFGSGVTTLELFLELIATVKSGAIWSALSL